MDGIVTRSSQPAPNLDAMSPTAALDPNKASLRDLDRAFHAAEARFTSGLSPAALWLAYADWALHLTNAPFRRIELAGLAGRQWQRMFQAACGRHVIDPQPQDHRFRSPAWQQPPYSLAQQAFLLAEEWWMEASDAGKAVSRQSARMVSFSMRQRLDMFSPSNLPWLNPDVIQRTAATGGRNFSAGFRNFLTDLHETTTGTPSGGAFEVGKNLAVTPGKVVFRNELIELIQYTPSSGTVRPEPVLIVPAWIMKYYILDLSAHNSLIGYLVGQGYTVFAISWRNPGPALQDTSLDDYREKGPLAALDVINAICGDMPVHACGYCLGGTLLAITAAAMARDGDHRLGSVTMFAAQTDFTEAGELQMFISEGQLAFLEDQMETAGTLDSRKMAGAFQMLRSNDLIWSHMINSYMLGQKDQSSDLMAWNADGTRMPARMHSEYLRHLFLNNDLAEGRFMASGRPMSLADIRVPFFVVGTESDHIAPWHSVYKINLLNPNEVTFVLTSGGHNAGIVSEPGHPHRHFSFGTRSAGANYAGPDEWAAMAERRDGSWWPVWTDWLDRHSGAMTKPPKMGAAAAGYPVLAEAPGSYVLEH
ncbi:alpha/beta hydrolase [Acidisphaera sp. S103]|uniref:PHA/PHB synthase family protein n=1 Tax=Acidisphaera sp. S103 TaxID=1747223 RepID=UPI00131CB486|nr:alpha/beta fold hydrolase [Acidisphaera sp. S103]